MESDLDERVLGRVGVVVGPGLSGYVLQVSLCAITVCLEHPDF